MNLFDGQQNEPKEIISRDGSVVYYGALYPKDKAQFYFEELMQQVPWENDVFEIYGKVQVTKRKIAWYGDHPYTYSKTTKMPLPWNELLLEMKAEVERATGFEFNSCLLNLYHNGEEGMGWHSDDEKEMGEVIASVSLGAERKFSFKHKQTKESVSLLLEHGSLLLMKGATQKNYLHSLPKSRKVLSARINLTFRQLKVI